MPPLTVIALSAPKDAALPQGQAEELATLALDAVLAWTSPERCLALSGSRELANLALGRGIAVVAEPAPREFRFFDLSRSARLALGELAAKNGPAEAVVFVNPYNPLLRADLLRRFAASFLKDPGSPLVSVKHCRDHPCQLIRYWSLAEVDILYLLDPDFRFENAQGRASAGVMVASKPFTPHRSEQYLPGGQFPGRPGGAPGQPRLDGPDEPVCQTAADGTLRLIFRLDPPAPGQGNPETDGRIAGVFGDQRNRAALIERTAAGEKRLYFKPDSAVRPGFNLRLIPFGLTQTHWDRIIEIEAATMETETPLSAPLPEDAVGCIACFLQESTDGRYDFQEMFQPAAATWCMRKGDLFNLETGRAIHGRQAFPAVYRIDGGLAACALQTVLAGEASAQNARAFLLGDEESIVVADRIGYLRSLARRQIREGSR